MFGDNIEKKNTLDFCASCVLQKIQEPKSAERQSVLQQLVVCRQNLNKQLVSSSFHKM